MEILNFILGLGSTVMLPIIIFVFGLIMRAGFSKSFKSGVTIGIGFTGINLVITLLTDQLGPVAQAIFRSSTSDGRQCHLFPGRGQRQV